VTSLSHRNEKCFAVHNKLLKSPRTKRDFRTRTAKCWRWTMVFSKIYWEL